MCQVNPHHAMIHENRHTIARDTMIIAIACPTDIPCVKRVFGVCHVDTFRAPLFSVNILLHLLSIESDDKLTDYQLQKN